jgi:hypothetical protein
MANQSIAEQFAKLGIVSEGRAKKAIRSRSHKQRICRKCGVRPCACEDNVTQTLTAVRQTRKYRITRVRHVR